MPSKLHTSRCCTRCHAESHRIISLYRYRHEWTSLDLYLISVSAPELGTAQSGDIGDMSKARSNGRMEQEVDCRYERREPGGEVMATL